MKLISTSILVTTLFLSMMGILFYTGNRIVTIYEPLIEASKELKFEATQAHLWFEEILSGDGHEDVVLVWKHLSLADRYAQAMLDGDDIDSYHIIALSNQGLREEVLSVRKNLTKFRQMANQRYQMQENYGPGSAIDQEFDEVFERFIDDATRIENLLHEMIQADLVEFRLISFILVIISMVLATFLTTILYKNHERIKNQLGNITQSNLLIEDKNNKLKEALSEKEMLLKEVYHRVKNNLQVVSSLINLQARYVHNETAADVLKQSADRIKSMALLHENLYQSKDLAKVDFNTYIHSLVNHLMLGYGDNSGKIKVNMEIDDVYLDVDTSIPCGLIVNELLSNALKHAFPENHPGKIDIAFTQNQKKYHLVISDNGIGFPPSVDYKKTTSLGLQLVITLTNQLMGQITLDQTEGSTFSIYFNKTH
jgi:two-component sensor histidine kinase